MVEKATINAFKAVANLINNINTRKAIIQKRTTGQYQYDDQNIFESSHKLKAALEDVAEGGASPELLAYFQDVDSLIEKFVFLERKIRDENLLAINHQNALDQAKRKSNWIDWSHRLVRWGLGVFAAFFIYSSFVWMSEKWLFFSVPIRDLFY